MNDNIAPRILDADHDEHEDDTFRMSDRVMMSLTTSPSATVRLMADVVQHHIDYTTAVTRIAQGIDRLHTAAHEKSYSSVDELSHDASTLAEALRQSLMLCGMRTGMADDVLDEELVLAALARGAGAFDSVMLQLVGTVMLGFAAREGKLLERVAQMDIELAASAPPRSAMMKALDALPPELRKQVAQMVIADVVAQRRQK
jgi:phosphomevalonate kinase